MNYWYCRNRTVYHQLSKFINVLNSDVVLSFYNRRAEVMMHTRCWFGCTTVGHLIRRFMRRWNNVHMNTTKYNKTGRQGAATAGTTLMTDENRWAPLSLALSLSLSLSLAISLSLSLSLSLPPLLLLDFCSLYLYVYNGVPSSALSLSRALSLSLSVAPSLSQIGYYFRPWFLYSKCICLIYHIRLAHTLSEAIYAIISVAIFFFFISYIFSGVRSLIIFLRLVCFLFFLLFYFNTFLKLTSVLTNMPSN